MEDASLKDDVLYKPLVFWTVLLAISSMWFAIQPHVIPMEMEAIVFVWIPFALILVINLYTLTVCSAFTLRTRYLRKKGFTGRRHPMTDSYLYVIAYWLPILYMLMLFGSLFMILARIDLVVMIGGVVWLIVQAVVNVTVVLRYLPRRKRRVVSRIIVERGEGFE